jgi:curved DNA-binding protein CbpA
LGVARHATAEQVRQAFRRAARRTHPDLGGRREEFEAVRSAYVTLLAQACRDPYARMLRELDEALTWECAAPRPRPTHEPRPTPASAGLFASVLSRVMGEVATAA